MFGKGFGSGRLSFFHATLIINNHVYHVENLKGAHNTKEKYL